MSASDTERRRRSGPPCVGILVFIALVCAAGFAYWRYVYYPTTPQYALSEFLDAAISEDYAAAYRRLHMPPAMRMLVPSAQSMQRLAENAGGLIPRLEGYRLGKVTSADDTATIVTLLITRQEGAETSTADELDIEMTRHEGQWKLDGGWALGEMVRRGGKALQRSLFD